MAVSVDLSLVSVPLALEDELFASVSGVLALEDELFAPVSGGLATEAKFRVSVSCCCFLLARSRDNILLKPSDPDGSFIGIFGVGLLGGGRLLVRMGMLCISFPWYSWIVMMTKSNIRASLLRRSCCCGLRPRRGI